MREIKFRAWDRNDKCWVLPDRFYLRGDAAQGVWHRPTSNHLNVALMQFTGLHDKNGKEIYEFDHIRHTNEEATDEVSTVPPLTFEHFDDYQGLFDSEWFDGEKYTNVEVVGNEYEGDI